MNMINILEELHNSSKLDKIAEHIYLRHFVTEIMNFPINKYFEDEGYNLYDWYVFCEFDKTKSSYIDISYSRHRLKIYIDSKDRNYDDVLQSIKHEVIHILDFLKSIEKNKGILLDKKFRKGYNDNSLSYYNYSQEFNQLIHYLDKLSKKIKFNNYQDLIEYLRGEESLYIDKEATKDPSFKKRLLSRIARENINIIKKPTPSGELPNKTRK